MNICYHRSGDYLFPNLTIEEKPVSYGKYGMLRKSYLKVNKKNWYTSMLLTGRLDDHLMEIDQIANERIAEIAAHMAKAENVTEQLKASDPMTWVAKMNNIWSCAEEIILNDLVYM